MEECYCSCKGTKYKHVHVPITGEFLVRNGKVLVVEESDYQGSNGDNETYVCYTELEDNEEE